MKNDLQIQGEAIEASTMEMLEAELFLRENYLLRRNVLNGKVEYAIKQDDDSPSEWKAMTQEAINSIVIRAKREEICEKGSPKTDIVEYINSDEIDYDQLYAQVLYELRVKKMPYWFNNSEVARIQELNKNFSAKTDIADIVSICFRKPAEGEVPMSMNCNQLMEIISKKYPTVKSTHSTTIYLGKAMKSLGYESTEWSHVAHYKVIPVKEAS